jgi:hypothetical protein
MVQHLFVQLDDESNEQHWHYVCLMVHDLFWDVL